MSDAMRRSDKRLVSSPYYKQFKHAESEPVDESDYSYSPNSAKKSEVPLTTAPTVKFGDTKVKEAPKPKFEDVDDAPKFAKDDSDEIPPFATRKEESKKEKKAGERKLSKRELRAEEEMVRVDYSPDNSNSFKPNSTSRATPYYMSYFAANSERPVYEDPIEPIIVDNRPKPKRVVFTALMVIMMAVIVAALVLSFVGVAPEYTALFTKGEETTIGLDDIIYGTLRRVGLGEIENESVFYNDCLAGIEGDDVSVAQMIAYYALPVSIVITIILAIYVMIKAIVACATEKRRKFPYLSLLLILFTLLGIVSGIIWNGGELTLGNIVAYFTFGNVELVEGSMSNVAIGIGYIILLGAEVLNLIFSACAYRSKKVSKF